MEWLTLTFQVSYYTIILFFWKKFQTVISAQICPLDLANSNVD